MYFPTTSLPGRNAYQGISSQFQLSSTQQDEYNRMGTLLTLAETVYANDSTWHSIDSSQLSVISNIATDISDRAGLWARSILALHGQAEYDFPVIIADSSKGSNTNPKPVVHSYSFHVYPDPANDYFAVEYCIEDREYKEARIQITAIDGKNMESKALDHPADQLLFKTGAYKPGIYFCKLRLDNKTAGVRRFTITKGEEGEAILSTIDGTAIETPAMMVYPNPSNGNFTVEYTTGSKQCNNCKLQIVNTGGKIMKAIAIDKPAGRKQIHAGDMEKGIYYLVFYQNNNPVSREKIIVQ